MENVLYYTQIGERRETLPKKTTGYGIRQAAKGTSMKLGDLYNAITIQGDVEIKVFDSDGNEEETRRFHDTDICCICACTSDLEDLEVAYVYAASDKNGTPRMVIEVTKDEM